MMGVAIVAGDILTPLGNLESTWNSMCDGATGLVSTQYPCVKNEYPLGLIQGLQGRAGSWKRLHSLLDALINTMPQLDQTTQLVVATAKGAVDELPGSGKKIEGQPWQIPEYLKNKLGLSRVPLTVSGACASGTLGVIQGAMQIAAGRCEQVLVVGVDLVADFIITGFDSLKGLSPASVRPFDKNRDGLALGDGGGWVLIQSEDSLAGPQPLAWVDGWGISCDATHITAPCRYGSGLKRVFDQMKISSNDLLGGINSHGTGTVYNDAMELLVFRDKCKSGTPICSGKGAIGHSLGASGVIEVMLSSISLQEMVLPPTVGLIDPEESPMVVSGEKMLPLLAPSIVSCNSGFGGINAAVRLVHR